jgi:hypothetical protein
MTSADAVSCSFREGAPQLSQIAAGTDVTTIVPHGWAKVRVVVPGRNSP